ncbi:tetratricopeptide repeat protein [Paracoccus subflavus]|uniref:protein O-GlcNAc transferase n=1 Tax=Paracoccus subflavus TaxID=2528244 RepID=A0A4Q9G2J7_9RHOB|nr:tetratricopeptide repeat protein [Paracoccus subflavus]TBN42032.1 tetratricopeptide repeat protein [Paracoccus subflavus]
MRDQGTEITLRDARKLEAAGRLSDARDAYGEVLLRFPGNKAARLALIRLSGDGKAIAVEAIVKASRLVAGNRHRDALIACHEALTLHPGDRLGWSIASLISYRMGEMDLARRFVTQAIEIEPEHYDSWKHLAAILRKTGEIEGAAAAYEQMTRLRPDRHEGFLFMGHMKWAAGRMDEAAEALGKAAEIGKTSNLYNDFGTLALAMGDRAKARDAYDRALDLDPANSSTHHNLGNLHSTSGLFPEALHHYRQAFRFSPDDMAARSLAFMCKTKMADWSAHAEFPALAHRIGIEGSAAMPWCLLCMEDDAARALKRSETYGRKWPVNRPAAWPARRPGPIRLGYVSADISRHATMFLLGGVLDHHDRDRFEVHMFALNPLADTETASWVKAAVHGLHEVSSRTDAEVVALARHLQLDIAIDLKGYTGGSRVNLFSQGLAPLQINYLGYPGSLGTGAWDYIIADDTVIPRGAEAFYAEKIIRLPGSYQPNDNRRPIDGDAGTRADHGLPDGAVVLCCFNDPYKITPREYDIWMRLMREHPETVLWLIEGTSWAAPALRQEAQARGVQPDRVVFAPRMSNAAHLARHRHADLFLDTFNVNAHTTASDALWAGLPVLTRPGQQFAARVGASLVRAAGLADLVAGSDKDYYEKAKALIANRAEREAVRKRLQAGLATSRLYATEAYTRDYEAALMIAHDLRVTENRFRHIAAEEIAGKALVHP